MLTAAGSDLGIVGPFFELKSLDAVLSELAKIMMQAGAQFRFFEEKTLLDYQMMLSYLKAQADWADHFWGAKTDRTQIDEIQAMVTEIAARSLAV
jgi:hypothetical protein